ncbi:DMT family transporter [Ancylobacter sp. 6x-1]|uniref:DMT family transporter n=1 Tax=Ancylobacter crimeensis TaxID=2579147 RepID=A0ABT0D7Q7_9HYPH|nr:DMT family transporter [Ancylobacter crimeensis]MCK0195969.1 DMT family transporter [Ancylobacter crimeensis]
MAFVADTLSTLSGRNDSATRTLSPGTFAALLLGAAALLWSGNFFVGRIMAGTLPPATLSLARWSLAFLLLLPFTGRELIARADVVRRHWPLLLACGVLNIAVFTVLIYAGLAHTSLINGSLIGSCAPIVVGILGWLILRDGTSRRQRLALGISTAGVALIVLRGDFSHLSGLALNTGDLLLFLGICAFGLYAVLLKRFPCPLSPAAALTASIPFGLVALAPFGVMEMADGTLGLAHPGAWHTALLSVAYVASLPTLGFVLWARGASVLGPARAGQFLQLMPVFGSGLAIGLLGEVPQLYHGIGLALVAGGLALRDRAMPEPAERS